MASITVYPVAGANSPVDGYIQREVSPGETFSTIRGGAGVTAYNSGVVTVAVGLKEEASGVNFVTLGRGILCFDTSAIPDNATIDSATLSLYGSSKTNGLDKTDLHIVSATPASTSSLATTDYSQTGTTSFGEVAYDDFSSGAYNDISLNASGLANISKTGITKFGVRLEWDVNGSFTGTNQAAGAQTRFVFSSADESGTSQDPKLVVNYTMTGFSDPTNAYTSNDTYATATTSTGDISVQLSGDGGTTYSSSLTKTFTSSESTETYGTGSTELWGLSWTGDNVDDTSFRVKVTAGSQSQIYKNFGFAPAASVTLTGIEVAIEAKWDGTTTSIDHLKVKIYYGTSVTPVQAGSLAYDSTLNKLAYYNGSAWKYDMVASAPTFTDFTNAPHDHGDADDGGAIAEAGIPDFSLANVSITNPYKFHVYKGDAQNTSTGAFVKVTFDTEQFDSNGNFASSTYTVPVNGFYHIFARVKIATAATAIIALYKGGAEYKRGTEYAYTAERAGLVISVMDQFAATDTLDIYVFDNSASAITTGQSDSYFGGYLISQA